MPQFATFQLGLGGGEAAAVELNNFLRSHRVLKVDKVAFPDGWTFCVEWIDGDDSFGSRNSTDWRKKPRVDYMKALSEDEFARFAKYRDRRREIANDNGVAAYMVMTDEQMAELAKVENPAIADLKKIQGFGEAKVAKYGEKMLAALSNPDVSAQSVEVESANQGE